MGTLAERVAFEFLGRPVLDDVLDSGARGVPGGGLGGASQGGGAEPLW